MKFIYTFLIGVVFGAMGLLFYQRSIPLAPLPLAVPHPVIAAPPIVCATIAPVAKLLACVTEAPAVAQIIEPQSTATSLSTSTPLPISASTPLPMLTANVPNTGQLLIPVAGISTHQLQDTFNQARGAERRHEAIDILAPRGTPVFAVADGKIVKLFDSKPGGLTAYQYDMSEKFAYYYAHLDRYAASVKEGSVLKQGELVGYVGTTGNSDPATPHLHFAIFEIGSEKKWWKGTPINPFPLLGGVQKKDIPVQKIINR